MSNTYSQTVDAYNQENDAKVIRRKETNSWVAPPLVSSHYRSVSLALAVKALILITSCYASSGVNDLTHDQNEIDFSAALVKGDATEDHVIRTQLGTAFTLDALPSATVLFYPSTKSSGWDFRHWVGTEPRPTAWQERNLPLLSHQCYARRSPDYSYYTWWIG